MNKIFTILFSNTIPGKIWGGGEKWILMAAHGLREKGHRILIAGRKDSVFLERARTATFETYEFNIHASFNPLKSLSMVRFLKQQSIDVIILNFKKDIRVAGLAARYAKVPVILARNGVQLFSNKWLDKTTVSLLDGIITNTQTIKHIYDSFAWMPENFVKVIYNGVRIPEKGDIINIKKLHKIPEDHFVFGSAGRLSPQKGFDLLIWAMSLLKKKNVPITVLIAGDGKHKLTLEHLNRSHNTQDRVRFIGFVEDTDTFIRSVDAVVLPSRAEGMPNFILEAMALGQIALATRVNGIQELLKHDENGFVTPPQDVEALAHSMEYVIQQRQRFPIVQKNALETVRTQYSVERMVSNLEQYLLQKYNTAHES